MWRTRINSIPAAGACEEVSELSECENVILDCKNKELELYDWRLCVRIGVPSVENESMNDFF